MFRGRSAFYVYRFRAEPYRCAGMKEIAEAECFIHTLVAHPGMAALDEILAVLERL